MPQQCQHPTLRKATAPSQGHWPLCCTYTMWNTYTSGQFCLSVSE